MGEGRWFLAVSFLPIGGSFGFESSSLPSCCTCGKPSPGFWIWEQSGMAPGRASTLLVISTWDTSQSGKILPGAPCSHEDAPPGSWTGLLGSTSGPNLFLQLFPGFGVHITSCWFHRLSHVPTIPSQITLHQIPSPLLLSSLLVSLLLTCVSFGSLCSFLFVDEDKQFITCLSHEADIKIKLREGKNTRMNKSYNGQVPGVFNRASFVYLLSTFVDCVKKVGQLKVFKVYLTKYSLNFFYF